MSFHPDLLAAHAQFGGDLEDMQRRYDAAPGTDMSIPSEVLALANEAAKSLGYRPGGMHCDLIARAIMRDRTNRAFQEERIRREEREACAVLAESLPLIQRVSPAHVSAITPQDVARKIRSLKAA